MNHAQWKTTRSRRLSGAKVEPTAEYIEAGYALALAEAVYDRRTQLGMTQAEVAERAGMSQPKVSAIEGGGHVPTLPLLQRLARALESHLMIDLDEEDPRFVFQPTRAKPTPPTTAPPSGIRHSSGMHSGRLAR
ncbi:helix-turn-helix domain-containing protein [Streptomyces sp. PD-S100-1]|uniref:helix-turn-helix domain-containing protein n=1 Tax=Streptomyces sp. PD-S100-1 TaxID=3394351 RepID=UPI0039BD8428